MRSPLVLTSAVLSIASGVFAQSEGCGKAIPGDIELGTSKNQTIDSESGHTPRRYRIRVPKTYDNSVPVPLILSYHGRGKDMKFQEKLSQFGNASYGFEGISVFPNGVPSVDKGTKQWQGDPDSPPEIDDVKFTMELIDELSATYCIDPSRIYAAGKSNGGGFTGVLACDSKATERIAAFAPVSGAYYLDNDTNELPSCNPTTTRDVIPIMEFHGLKDDTIKYDGGPNTRGNANSVNIPQWVDGWATRNGFDINANVTTSLCKENRRVTRYSWNETVVHYALSNMYHDWPSTFPNGDTSLTTCAEADATSVILEWFKKWKL